jgi:hypothetical protein
MSKKTKKKGKKKKKKNETRTPLKIFQVLNLSSTLSIEK